MSPISAILNPAGGTFLTSWNGDVRMNWNWSQCMIPGQVNIRHFVPYFTLASWCEQIHIWTKHAGAFKQLQTGDNCNKVLPLSSTTLNWNYCFMWLFSVITSQDVQCNSYLIDGTNVSSNFVQFPLEFKLSGEHPWHHAENVHLRTGSAWRKLETAVVSVPILSQLVKSRHKNAGTDAKGIWQKLLNQWNWGKIHP